MSIDDKLKDEIINGMELKDDELENATGGIGGVKRRCRYCHKDNVVFSELTAWYCKYCNEYNQVGLHA